jgi:hypothetical protein
MRDLIALGRRRLDDARVEEGLLGARLWDLTIVLAGENPHSTRRVSRIETHRRRRSCHSAQAAKRGSVKALLPWLLSRANDRRLADW